ncbi:ATP-binding protein [Pedobacter sp. SL55]|uniref:ATP-binding protein n=1 Tax=Pedobacter sp. SL55 TaxID=2995161 RepID=UPI00226D8D0C|nr:ATP-binding protein [Pedobacter sp. SL55]WAC39536.1 ATP-binding protein [Pedobacter sp. SL55]
MKIKTKLLLGVGLLFAMIVLLTALSGKYINQLSADAKNILTDNYKSVDYARQMLDALNGGIQLSEYQRIFQLNLRKQQATITEPGELELTAKIAKDFRRMLGRPTDQDLKKVVHQDVSGLMLLNMKAIQRKNNKASDTADEAILWIVFSGSFCFLVAFVLLVNLPSNIANPIRELTQSIREVADMNYTQRVHFEGHSEFGELARSFNTMAKKLQEYSNSSLEKLMMEKKRIETLIDNMSEPVIGLDHYKTVLFANDKALQITGLNQADMVGRPIEEVMQQNDLIRTLFMDIDPNKRNSPVKIYADKKESYFEKEIIPIGIVPTGESKEKLIGLVIVLKNVTSYKELDFAKTNFIATVSHELKTPIAAIKMSLQLLRNKQVGQLNKEQESLADSIGEDTERLLKITGELLNITQVESGSINLSMASFDITEIMDYAVNATRTAAEQKNISVKVLERGPMPKIYGDSEKSAWVLTNLLSNAIRYSYEHSKVELVVSQDADGIKLAVKDGGQGISEEYIDKIFDRYFRIPGSKKDGTGLGLSISKEFVEAQGGTINVQSELGKGSIFTISFKPHSR